MLMLVSGVPAVVLVDAAESIGARAEVTTLSLTGLRHRVKLYPTTPRDAWRVARDRERLCPVCGKPGTVAFDATDGRMILAPCGDAVHPRVLSRGTRWPEERGDSRYQRIKRDGNGGRVRAVCWHGFRDFFRAVFALCPDAVFRTGLATWRGSADFEARYPGTGYKNIGSQFCPMLYAEACRCKDAGYAR
jgi:hypothetical protein